MKLIPVVMTACLALCGQAQSQDVVRLGNLKLAHFGAVSYIKETATTCGIRVEERCSPRGWT